MTYLKQRALMIGLIILGIGIVGFFGLRAFHAFRQFRGHRPPPPAGRVETDTEKIRDWMTIPFISRMYLIPDRILFEKVGIPEDGNREKSLKVLNDEYFPDENGIVMEKIKAAIQDRQPPSAPLTAATAIPPTTTAAPQP